MKLISGFDPSASVSGAFDPGVANPCGRIILFNESPIGITLRFANGDTGSLPPYYYRSFVVSKPGLVQWSQAYSLQTTMTLSQIIGESYESSEARALISVEGPLNRQANIGNSVPLSTSATNVTDDGRAAGQLSVEATVVGDATSAVKLTNDGKLTLGSATHPGQISFDNGKIVSDGAGNVTITGYFTVIGNGQVANWQTYGTLFVQGASTLDNGHISTNGSGALTVASLALSSGSLSRLFFASGTGTATITHGFGIAPSGAVGMYSGAFSPAPSQAIAWKNATNTTIDIVGQAGFAWTVMIYRN